MTKVAIATVNWNRKEDTLEFLESLKKLDTKGILVKTFVVSNQKLFGIDVILKKQNRGSAGGYNDGVRAGLKWGADYFLLVNNDILVSDPKLLQSLFKTAQSDQKTGAVSPKMYFAPGFEFYKDRYFKSDRGRVIWYAGGRFDWNNINSSHRGIDEVDIGQYDTIEETGFTSGSCVLVKRAIFDQGIFWNESLFAYLDDNDFQEKIKRAGFKLYYDGGVSVYHKVSQTSGIGSPISDYYITRNRLIFGMRYASLRTKFNLLREAFRLLFFGRSMQKRGIMDFFIGKRGELGPQTTL